MARAGILYSHVAAAAAKLVGDGKNPTVDTVREALGATGSKSTIAPMLKRWKEEHAGTLAQVGSGLPAALLQAVKTVYDDLRADVMGQLERSATAHRLALTEANAEAQRMGGQNAALVAEKTELMGDLAHSHGTLTRLQSEIQLQNVVLASVQSDNAGLVQRLGDRTAEVAAINEQLARARTQFEHYQESSATQRTEERQSYERRIAQQDHELGRLRQHLELKQVEAAQQAGQLARMVEENQRLHTEGRALQKEHAQLKTELDQAASQLAELASTRPAILAKQEGMEKELSKLRTTAAVLTREVVLTSERLAGAENREDELIQEKLGLLQHQATLEVELRLCRAATKRPAS